MKKIISALILAASLVTSANACDCWDFVVIETPKGDFVATEVVYLPDEHSWLVNMAEDFDHPFFQTVLPCNWVRIWDEDGEVTEAEAMTW